MKKIFLLLVFVAIIYSIIFSQGCLPEGITFYTQEEIDNFQEFYPGCSEIIGYVQIGCIEECDGIYNLEGLSVITSIGQSLTIDGDDNLNSFIGLHNLTYIGGDLYVLGKDLITSLAGFESLTTIGGELYIGDNLSLSSLEGLSSLTFVEGNISVGANNYLTNFTGLESLESIGGYLLISNNETLSSFTGLESLSSIGYFLWIVENNELTNLIGLDNLTSITDYLLIEENPSLLNLEGLESLTSLGGELIIRNNDALNSITGLDNIDTSSITNLYLYSNHSLTACNFQSICNFLNNPHGTINIYNNAPGCNSSYEVMSQCGITTMCLPYGNYYLLSQFDINNFQTHYPACSNLKGNVTIYGNDIASLSGLSVVNSIAGNLYLGSIDFGGNPELINLEGLENLDTVGAGIFISNNPYLSSLTGLSELDFLGGSLKIFNNDALINLNLPEDLFSIGGGLSIENNNALTSLSGLGHLKTLGGYLFIVDNSSLNNIEDLDSLILIDGELRIKNNDALTNLFGLENIDANSMGNLVIYSNNLLSDCDVKSICEYLNIASYFSINNNATGCADHYEVEAACLTSVEEKITSEEITLFPNPASDFITVVAPQSQEIEEIIFYNQLGQVVLSVRDATNSISISELSPGIYFAAVRTADRKLMTKVFIE